MKLDIQWLAYLATEEGMLDSARCLVLKHALGPDPDLLDFGEKLLDRGYCSDFEKMQELVNQAFEKAENGDPVPSNPFDVWKSKTRPSTIPLRRKSIDSTDGPSPSLRTAADRSSPSVRENRPSLNNGESGDSSIDVEMAIPPRPQADTHPSETPSPGSSIRQTPPTVAPSEPVRNTVTQTVFENAAHGPKEFSPSKERPGLSLEVSDDWPDLNSVQSASDSEIRQMMVQLLLNCRRVGASDLHLSADARPFYRLNRQVAYLYDGILTAEASRRLNTALLSEFEKSHFESHHDLDHALSLDLHLRYRVNLMEHKDGMAGTYRIIPDKIKSLEELGFGDPKTIRKLLTYHNGLIMVTGPLGSGKTTTLASLVDELNKQRQDHLITVESPIEIVQQSHQCQITQREVGSHTKNFHSALKGALRQDPDIIVIGEMRDLETVEMAISASETGHLVIGTMHTSDAANTLNRLLDVFPAAQQTQIRSMVAESLRGIICQRLLPSTDGGVELAYELLLNNAAVGNLIRTNKADGLSNIIETGRNEGMVLMDKSILALWEQNRIPDQVALSNLVSASIKQQILQKDFVSEDDELPAKRRFSFKK